jgi:hypothetical protein
MNRQKQMALGNMLFDVAKYLFTSIAIGTFVVENVKPSAFVVSFIAASIIALAAYTIIPKDKEEN